MSAYKLYNEVLICKDSTLHDFARCVVEGVPADDICSTDEDDYKDEFINLVEVIINEDIVRTDINYEGLMYKYRSEIGEVLYDMENNGYDIGTIGLTFFGMGTQLCFNELIKAYISIHFESIGGRNESSN